MVEKDPMPLSLALFLFCVWTEDMPTGVLSPEYRGPCAPWLMQFNHADNQPH